MFFYNFLSLNLLEDDAIPVYLFCIYLIQEESFLACFLNTKAVYKHNYFLHCFGLIFFPNKSIKNLDETLHRGLCGIHIWKIFLRNSSFMKKSTQTCCISLLLMLRKLILVIAVACTTLINLRSSSSELFLEKGFLRISKKNVLQSTHAEVQF